jgi:phosphatidylglycerol:prolipoprotein diacylglycerol transferase
MKLPLFTVADLAAIATPIALLLVRCANFINGELWGAVTDAPWGVVFGGAAGLEPRHPTQLYEAALEGLVLFIVLNVLARRRPPLPQGSYFGIFLVGYGVFRIAVEFVRQPDQQIGYLFGTDWVTMGMVLTVPMLLVGAGFLAYAVKRRLPQASGVKSAAAPDVEAAESVETLEADESAEGVQLQNDKDSDTSDEQE